MRTLFCLFTLCLLALALTPPEARASQPNEVAIGLYIADIQEIDLKTHSYRLDLYMWFRWKNPEIDPSQSAEFINMFEPADHVRTTIFDKPQVMPDGSLYMIIRDQGKFSSKFSLKRYPFDRQTLDIILEDNQHEAGNMVYVADTSITPLTLNPAINVPGFNLRQPRLDITTFKYPTNFGDLRSSKAPDYSRVRFSIGVERPWLATGLNIFLPIILIIICTALVLSLHPVYIEGRLGVAITALLTLVALQLTSASGLPDVDYMLMTDKVYLLSYLFIMATMIQTVRHSNSVHEKKFQEVWTNDHKVQLLLCAFMIIGIVGVILLTL
ncbi:MAG: hypothetical protein NDJ24_04885 [Alphaproteobacteria bacterium]|nr:hypothetical protein [Alphaproteobacteria bacterium]